MGIFDKKNSEKPDRIVESHHKEILLAEIVRILNQYGGEGNVPINSEYWDMLRTFRAMK